MTPDSPLVTALAPSPNHGERRGGAAPSILLLHYTGMADGAAALARLRDPAAEVSAHYLVTRGGEVLQLVPEARRAWHAGAGAWAGEGDVNSASIGIEVDHPGHAGGNPPFEEAALLATVALARDVVARRGLAPERVLAHSDVAPGRKEDPGERFPWDRLAAAGAGHWLPPDPPDEDAVLALGDRGERVARLRDDLARLGHPLVPGAEFDAATAAVVRAFQLHHRPARADGRADRSTRAGLARLLAARAPAGPVGAPPGGRR